MPEQLAFIHPGGGTSNTEEFESVHTIPAGQHLYYRNGKPIFFTSIHSPIDILKDQN